MAVVGFLLRCAGACGFLASTGVLSQQLVELQNHALDPRDLDTSAVALADVDGDRDCDLVVANGGSAGHQQSNLYANDGNGVFRHVPGALPAALRPTAAVGAGDLDGDGDVDLVFGNFGYGLANVVNQVLINDGRGVFADETAARMPVFTSLCTPVQPSDATRGVAVVDVDRDGDLDSGTTCRTPSWREISTATGTSIWCSATPARTASTGTTAPAASATRPGA
jgi:hypothetical protein